jgi:hypothetical protein
MSDQPDPDPALLAAIGDGLSRAVRSAASAHEAHECDENARVRHLMHPDEARAWLAAFEAARSVRPYEGDTSTPLVRKHQRKGERTGIARAADAICVACWHRCGKPHEGWLTESATVSRFWSDVRRLAALAILSTHP